LFSNTIVAASEDTSPITAKGNEFFGAETKDIYDLPDQLKDYWSTSNGQTEAAQVFNLYQEIMGAEVLHIEQEMIFSTDVRGGVH